jgi:hypothetical protein
MMGFAIALPTLPRLYSTINFPPVSDTQYDNFRIVKIKNHAIIAYPKAISAVCRIREFIGKSQRVILVSFQCGFDTLLCLRMACWV